jgi:hypothetical protein
MRSADPAYAWMLGTGRCGSTLVHEVLARHPDVGFLSNVEDNVPRLGWTGRWNGPVFRREPNSLTTKGRLRFAPSEAYGLLERRVSPMLATPVRDLTAGDATPWLADRLRGVFDEASKAQGRPLFLHKFTGWPRVGLTEAVFPGSRFHPSSCVAPLALALGDVSKVEGLREFDVLQQAHQAGDERPIEVGEAPRLQPSEVVGPNPHALVEQRHAAAGPLGPEHRSVGFGEKGRRVGGTNSREGHADAGPDPHVPTGDANGRFQAGGKTGCHRKGVSFSTDLFAHRYELVAPQAADRVGRAQGGTQTFAGRHQDGIAGLMAHRVVDGLEVVKIHEQHSDVRRVPR